MGDVRGGAGDGGAGASPSPGCARRRPRRGPLGVLRTVLAAVLVVAACVCVPAGALSVWAKYEIGDTDSFVSTVSPLAADHDVREAVATAVTNGVMDQVDLGPLNDQAREFVHDAAVSFTGSEAFRDAWDAATHGAHAAVVKALNDEESGGDITIDLGPVTEQVKQKLVDNHVPYADRIPVAHTDITFVESRELGTAREVFHAFETAGPWPAVAALVLAAAGLLLAHRRLRALALTALGFALAGVVLRIVVMAGRAETMDRLPSDIARPAAGAGYDALTHSLTTAAWWLTGAGGVVCVGLLVLSALRRRRRPGPASREDPPGPRGQRWRVQRFASR
ncbi:hypothetical protein AB0J21_09965 [Streptomyces sp. NPDC049954]|uniref:hypothetical protein n=1 Tax=Streptomyces sp. NPDC049954 TaxID=3155779 RepID=UPI003429EDE5